MFVLNTNSQENGKVFSNMNVGITPNYSKILIMPNHTANYRYYSYNDYQEGEGIIDNGPSAATINGTKINYNSLNLAQENFLTDSGNNSLFTRMHNYGASTGGVVSLINSRRIGLLCQLESGLLIGKKISSRCPMKMSVFTTNNSNTRTLTVNATMKMEGSIILIHTDGTFVEIGKAFDISQTWNNYTTEGMVNPHVDAEYPMNLSYSTNAGITTQEGDVICLDIKCTFNGSAAPSGYGNCKVGFGIEFGKVGSADPVYSPKPIEISIGG